MTAEPKDWGLHYPERLVKLAYQMARNADWQRIPRPDEIADLDPRWLDDLFLVHRLVQFKQGSEIVKLGESAGPRRWQGLRQGKDNA